MYPRNPQPSDMTTAGMRVHTSGERASAEFDFVSMADSVSAAVAEVLTGHGKRACRCPAPGLQMTGFSVT
jgi:hypothetical protein